MDNIMLLTIQYSEGALMAIWSVSQYQGNAAHLVTVKCPGNELQSQKNVTQAKTLKHGRKQRPRVDIFVVSQFAKEWRDVNDN